MKLVLKYGGVVAAGSFAWLLAEYFLGYRTTRFDVHLTTSLFSVVILAMGVVFAILARKSQEGSKFKFKQGFITGLGVSMVAGVLMIMGQYIYFVVVDPGYPTRAKTWSTYIQVIDGTPLEEAKANTQDNAWKYNVNARAFAQVPLFLVQGAIISALGSAIIVRRK